MSFADRLKEARLGAGMTQQQLANKINVGNTAVSNYEKGASFPNIDVLYLIFDALNVSPNFLFQDSVPIHEISLTLSENEKELIHNYRRLNQNGQNMLKEYLRLLTTDNKYQKQAALQREATYTIAAYGGNENEDTQPPIKEVTT